MEGLDKKTQLDAVKKVLEEKKKAEEYVKSWNASWWEQLSNAHCLLLLRNEISEDELRNLERKYNSRYKLEMAFYSDDSIGIPLAKETLVSNNTLVGETSQNFEVEFGKIDWFGMNSHKSTRHFSFNNNGIIEFSKSSKVTPTLKHPRKISYTTSFDVLSNDFDISIDFEQLTDEEIKRYRNVPLTLSLKGNILIEKFDNIDMIRDLSTGMKLVRIVRKYDERNKQNNASIIFEAALNLDGSLEYGSVEIQTHKGNAKINGTYRFAVSRKKGVSANFYSRKGIKADLTSNPTLLDTVNTLLPQANSNNNGDIIVFDFANSVQEIIAKSLNKNVVSFDYYSFNMEPINQIEKAIIEMVKCIRGELPLTGLVIRIDNCLEMISKNQIVQNSEDSNYKVLKLESPNKS